MNAFERQMMTKRYGLWILDWSWNLIKWKGKTDNRLNILWTDEMEEICLSGYLKPRTGNQRYYKILFKWKGGWIEREKGDEREKMRRTWTCRQHGNVNGNQMLMLAIQVGLYLREIAICLIDLLFLLEPHVGVRRRSRRRNAWLY